MRRNANSYYLTELFAKSKKGIDEGEIIFDDDLFEAVGISETGLYNLIEKRLTALKKLIKKGSDRKQELCISTDSPKDEMPEMAAATILKSVEAVQVYLFHWQLCIYADADILKHQYLIAQFPEDLFGFLDRHMTLHHKLSNHGEVEVDGMKIIVQRLMKVLRDLVVGQRLLDDREFASAISSQ